MAENTKKFLDFTGLQKYDKLLKAKVSKDIKAVQDDLDTRKVKDTAESDNITWSKGDGTYTASVKGVVLDNADYADVKKKATQSAAAWGKFLEGTLTDATNPTPKLSQLATKTETSDALASAKSYADGLASNYDKAGAAAQALADAKAYTDGLVKDAEGNVKFDTVGSAAKALEDAKKYAADQDTANLATAKTYAEEKATAAETAAKAYADGLASNYDAAGSAATAEQNAKDYADGLAKNYDAAGSAEAAKTAAISEAKSYTDGKISEVNDAISGINTSIAGGVHFRGVVAELPASPFTGYTNGDIVIVGEKEYILNKPESSTGDWIELGDTTQESQRITTLEGHVDTLRGDENTTGSVAKALKDANTYTDGAINTLVNTGKVKENTDAIAILRGADTVEGSVAKALKDAKAYADTKKSEAISDTDTKIDTLVGETGQVGKNTAAIAKLNGNSSTVGSVDYKIAQAVSNIEASIDTITEDEITGLFPKQS